MSRLRSTGNRPPGRLLYLPKSKSWQNASYNFRELVSIFGRCDSIGALDKKASVPGV